MLKSPIQQLTLFFDMEWVPDAEAARRLFDLSPEVTEVEAMEQLWKSARGYDPETNPRPFVKYLLSRVVSIAFLSRKPVVVDGQTNIEFGLHSLPQGPVEGWPAEAPLIDRFLYILGERCPQLVGYNSAASDIQVLIQRGMINEISAEKFCERPDKPWEGTDYFRRWDNEDHLDILKLFGSSNGMAPRLDEFAKLCGYPGKIDVKGDQVTDLWLKGDVTKIVEYNQVDALNTYLLWLRLVHFCGKLSGEEYYEETEQFQSFLAAEAQKPEKAFVADFLAKWPAA